jgi:hypothetical protein
MQRAHFLKMGPVDIEPSQDCDLVESDLIRWVEKCCGTIGEERWIAPTFTATAQEKA